MIESPKTLEHLPLPAEPPAEPALDDLLITWGEITADPEGAAAFQQLTPGLDDRIAAIEAQIGAALAPALQPLFTELINLHQQRADEWGFSGVEFARRAVAELLRPRSVTHEWS